MHTGSTVRRPELVCAQRRESKHVGRNGDVSEGKLAADNPRPRYERAFEMVEQLINRRPRRYQLLLSYLTAHGAPMDVLVEFSGPARGLLYELVFTPPIP